MAELLVKYFQETTFDIGDVVVIAEDGHVWGKEEDPNTATAKHFFICKIPGVPVADVQQFIQKLYDSNDWSDPESPPNTIKKRRFNLDDVKIPNPIVKKIERDGIIEITAQQFNTFVNDKSGVI